VHEVRGVFLTPPPLLFIAQSRDLKTMTQIQGSYENQINSIEVMRHTVMPESMRILYGTSYPWPWPRNLAFSPVLFFYSFFPGKGFFLRILFTER
jgi:hypothetical protein